MEVEDSKFYFPESEDPGIEADEQILPAEEETARHENVKKIAEKHGIPLPDWRPKMLEDDTDS